MPGNTIKKIPGRFDDLVEDAVRVTEVAAHDVPVRLLALTCQFDQIDEHGLHVLAELFGSHEALLGVLTARGLRALPTGSGALGGTGRGRCLLGCHHERDASSPY